MKKLVLFISIVVASAFFSSNASAQGKYGADSAECIKYLSYYTEYYKQKNYESALPNWRKAYALCPPTARYSLLSDGTTLLRREISKSTTSPEYKKKLIDSLMTIYDQRVEYWPKYKVASLNNQALDMYNYMKNDNQALYAGLSKVIAANGNNTKPNIFLFHFNAAVNLYKDGLLDAEKLIADYDKAIETIGSIQPKSEIEKKLIADNVEKIESLFIGSQVASCDNLLTLFTPRFEAAPSDLVLAKNIVKMLQLTEDCVDNDLYLNAVNVIYAQEPSHSSAYYLYKLYSSRGDFDNAVKYIDEAVNFEESDADADAGYLYDFATFCFKNGNNSKAYEAASKVVELSDSYDGKAYWLMGSIWAAAPCGGDEIERRAKYWVATDLMIKAKNADPALVEDADRSISQYKVYYPNTADAFMYNLTNGQSYTVSCGGMRAVTTVRTNN